MFKGFETPEAFESFLLKYAKEIVQRIEKSGYHFIGDSVYWRAFVCAVDDAYFSNEEVIEFYGGDVLSDEVKKLFFQDTFMSLSRLVLSMLVSKKLVDKQLFTKEQAQLYVDATLSLWYHDNNQSAKLCQIRGNFKRKWSHREKDNEHYTEKALTMQYYLGKIRHLLELQESFGGNIEAIGHAEKEIQLLRSGFVLWRIFQDYRHEYCSIDNQHGMHKSPEPITEIKQFLFGNRYISLDEIFQLESESRILEELLAIDVLMEDVLSYPAKCLFSHALSHQFMQIAEIPMHIGIDLYNDEEVNRLDAYDGYVKEAIDQIRAKRS